MLESAVLIQFCYPFFFFLIFFWVLSSALKPYLAIFTFFAILRALIILIPENTGIRITIVMSSQYFFRNFLQSLIFMYFRISSNESSPNIKPSIISFAILRFSGISTIGFSNPIVLYSEKKQYHKIKNH